MDIKQELRKRGMTEQQINSKVVSCFEEIMLDNQDIVNITAAKTLQEKVDSAVKTLEKAESYKSYFESYKSYFDDAVQSANSKIRQMSLMADVMQEHSIVNSQLQDAFALYCAIIDKAKSTFGDEKMTESVIVQLLETASFAVWRGIMGSKFDDGGNKKVRTL